MKNDLHKTFGQIFDNDITALRNQLIDVQHHQANRKDAEKWVKRLRFLDISNIPAHHGRKHFKPHVRRARCFVPVTRQKDDDGEKPYVAVSWKWATQPGSALRGNRKDVKYDYMIQRLEAVPHKSEFPDEYLERVIMFAQSKNIPNIWIDKECIYQMKGDSPDDKDRGVQIMDVVYGHSSASVGLLTTPLVTQDEVDTLASLLGRSLFLNPYNTESPEFESSFDIREVQMLILKILSDTRWSRGWIFQEDHLASAKMSLLIPCAKFLKKGNEYDFGSLPGELEVRLRDFREAVTMFCLANTEDEESWPNSEFLSKAKQYKIWNKKVYETPNSGRDQHLVHLWSDDGPMYHSHGEKLNTKHTYSNISLYPTMTNSVLDDICSRSLENEEDRIAILANALKFPKRLDIRETSPILEANNYSLSVAMLALILINGEILKTSEFEEIPSANNLMRHTLRSYLKQCEYTFNAPNFRFEQSFINRCRLKSPVITQLVWKPRAIYSPCCLPMNSTLSLIQSDSPNVIEPRLHESHASRWHNENRSVESSTPWHVKLCKL
jgi:hypothetical protein